MKILITGASSGIGQATAYKFAQAKEDLILTYFKNKPGAKKTQQECLKLGAQSAEIFELDLSQEKNILDFTKKIIKQYKSIDILINNAGFLATGKITDMNFSEIEQIMAVNLIGLIKLTSKLLPFIKNTIINIGSGLPYESKREFSVYCASKHGVRGFTKSLAKEYPHLKIYLVNPGLVITQMSGFKGVSADKVAEIIFKAAKGQYKAKSGAHINFNDYRYGQKFVNLFIFLKKIKKIFKT